MRSYPDHVEGPGSLWVSVPSVSGQVVLGCMIARGECISKQPSLWVLLSSWIMTWKCRPHKPSFPGCLWPECLSLQQRGNQSRVLCEETQCVINFPFGYWDRDRPGSPGWALPCQSSFLSLQCMGLQAWARTPACFVNCELELSSPQRTAQESVGVFISPVPSVYEDVSFLVLYSWRLPLIHGHL